MLFSTIFCGKSQQRESTNIRSKSSSHHIATSVGLRQHRHPVTGGSPAHKHVFHSPSRTPWDSTHPTNEVVAFYNLFIKNPDVYPEIVNDQLDLLEITGLLKILDMVYYVTIGESHETIPEEIKKKLSRSFLPQNFRVNTGMNVTTTSSPVSKPSPKIMKYNKFFHLSAQYDSVDETLTLSYLYHFCQTHPNSTVLYFHNKGSFHQSSLNTQFRQLLDCYVLNPNCLDAFDNDPSLDICGLRFSVFPMPHYSGNYWWAKCSYINKLVHPGSMVLNQTMAKDSEQFSKFLASGKRYFAEAWVGSYPVVNAADCMGPETDVSFLCCYQLDNVSAIQCPNHVHNYEGATYQLQRENMLSKLAHLSGGKQRKVQMGSKCKASSVLTNGRQFSKAYDYIRGIQEHDCKCGDLLEALRLRTLLWYGQEPITALKASQALINIHDVIDQIPEKAVLRDRYDARVTFLYDQGKVYTSESDVYRDLVKVLHSENITISTKLPIIDLNMYQINEIKKWKG